MGGVSGARVSARELEAFVRAVLRAVGLPEADAGVVAWALVQANLEGVDTHGVSRLAMYARRVRAGQANPRPELRWSHPAPGIQTLDADNALGPVAAMAAMEAAISLAREQGIGMVTVAHTNHAAALSAYVERAAAAGCIAMMVCNTPKAMPPWGGREAFLGTNPLAFAAPAGDGAEPVVVDMATTVVARGNIIMAARQGAPIPADWALDAEGRPTTDAAAALAGAVLPMAGAKGYALALMIEILAAIISGSAYGPQVRSPYEDSQEPTDSGIWVMAFNVSALMPAPLYAQRMGALLEAIHASPAAPGQETRVPGERRAQTRQERLAGGVPLDAATRAELETLAVETGVPPLEARPQPEE
jgi:LDH2 family malate/lactate/ureidoglycolate dehydrogenase